jgi:predicted CXXCH cytochrome family protein
VGESAIMRSFISLILFALNLASPLFATLPARVLHVTSIAAPTRMESCQGALWVYSATTHSLFQLNLRSGKVIKQHRAFTLDGSAITTLGCSDNKLILALWNKKKKQATLMLYDKQGKKRDAGSAPGKGIVQDLLCENKFCYLLSDQLYHTSNLSEWQEVKIPAAVDILPTKKELERNPFKGMQSKLLIAHGRYTRLVSESETMWFLDPLRVNIVKFSQKEDSVTKWGRWGVWGKRMLFPKSLALYRDHIVITDASLKLLFVFSKDGKFQATFGPGKGRFGYPIDLVTHNDTVFVSDFLSNKVYLLKLHLAREPEKKLEAREHRFHHKDVLRDWHKIRCLNCHDGMEAFHLDKLAAVKNHHPILTKLEEDGKIDLPLSEDKFVSCATCHDNHHRDAKGDLWSGKSWKLGATIPHKLRKPYNNLCQECHNDKFNSKENHIIPLVSGEKTNSKEPSQCIRCHQMHQSDDKLLKLSSQKLCLECHEKKGKLKSHPLNEKSSCIHCHAPHKAKRDTRFARFSRDDTAESCLDCHKKKREFLDKNKHFTMEVDSKIKWPSPENACVNCHKPHKKKAVASKMCMECHKKRKLDHQEEIPFIHMKRAKGISLDNKRITCLTCHDAHIGGMEDKHLKSSAPIRKFCVGCHDTGMDNLYKNYHKLFKKKKKGKKSKKLKRK